ncbi:MAG: M1 family metallopeptidase [Balneolaceae bacterium]
MVKTIFQTLLFLLLSFQITVAQDSLVYESGGVLSPEQASFNVHFYDLDVKVDPTDKTVGGTVGIYFDVVNPTNVIELALDPRLEIESISKIGDEDENLKFTRKDSSKQVLVYFPQTLQPGEKSAVLVTYDGQPREAENPPWDGGLVWDKTPSGEPWVGVATQTIGAWTWWPNKDHPSDKADSVSINLTMPDDLTVASNGRSKGTTDLEDGWKTWHWFVSTPINNYNITINAAPYETISETYTSIAGDEMDITFWVLPEFMEEGEKLFPQFAEQIEFLENILGPYPFRADKYGVAHAPYLGMEHQTLIAYGANFENDNLFGLNAEFDDLHQHELAHEWWGNHITAWDWRDFWIHEGFGTYMQALYAEHLSGKEAYHEMIELFKNRISSQNATAPRESQSSLEITDGGRGGDVYYKGAAFLHTLRFYIGDDAFFESLRRFSYPDPEMESVTDGSQNRFATTDDFLNMVESITNQDLDWLFEVYLRQAELPKLDVLRRGDVIRMQWSTQGETAFPMPIELKIGDERINVVPENGVISIEIGPEVDVEIDPDGLILMDINFREG